MIIETRRGGLFGRIFRPTTVNVTLNLEKNMNIEQQVAQLVTDVATIKDNVLTIKSQLSNLGASAGEGGAPASPTDLTPVLDAIAALDAKVSDVEAKVTEALADISVQSDEPQADEKTAA